MTVCIAAVATEPDGFRDWIVAASDSMLTFSGGAVTADGVARKDKAIGDGWHVMTAGDASECSLILQRLKKEVPYGERCTAEGIAEAITRAYKDRLQQRIQSELLDPYGLTFGELSAEAEVRSRIDWLIREFDAEFLVYGFEGDVPAPEPHIFSVRPPGVLSSQNATWFWAIGSGAELALNSLIFSGQTYPHTTLENTIWNVAVAKFRAEQAQGVGRRTEIVILDNNGRPYYLLDGGEIINQCREHLSSLEADMRIAPDTVKEFLKSRYPKMYGDGE